MSSEESKDYADFLTFVFSIFVKISIMEKLFLRQLHLLAVYSRYLFCISWKFSVGH